MTTTIGRIGYWSGLAACASAIAYDVVQILQLLGLLTFPLDEVLIYGTSLCIVLPLILMMLSLHYLTHGPRRFWTHAAVILTTLYAVFVTANYVVQLATVIPAKLAGRVEAVRVLEQTPHSLFWSFDAVGYIAMGLAALCAALSLGKGGVECWARRSLIAHALVTPLIGIVYFHPTFSPALLLLGLPWAITAPAFMLCVALMLRARSDRLP
ncbi:hypothetical protein [Halomonas nitroreducens]|uniref:DUF4386 family protein n=1 Tax=Halomonas nitroreducens TaxID=447425 RepID=A0A3S0HNH7_9GAMM|nr:hypothetical protein [Halomonas nitroreducens]RTR01059.1 hypothetical protein EKG36_14425 [Halomonas nitroreducens]